MDRIEELISNKVGICNSETYSLLKKEILKSNLVCFFGSGLSLYPGYCSWSSPFQYIKTHLLHRLEDALAGRRKPDKTDIDIIQKCIDTLKTSVSDDINNKEYLSAGDKMEDIINQTRGILDDLGMGALNYTSFNDACNEAFHNPDVSTMEIQPFTSPYSIPAIYYLPHLGIKKCITTNVEESFERVCSEQSITWNECVVRKDDHLLKQFSQKNINTIFYVHGKLPEYSTLIMTQQAYNSMYEHNKEEKKPISGAAQILRHVAETNSVLFLGAGLQKDKTVEIIQTDSAVNADGKLTNNRNYFVVVQQAENGTDIIDRPKFQSVQFQYNHKQYQEISSLLLQLIRDTSTSNYPCTWQIPINNTSTFEPSELTINAFDAFLQNNSPFARYDYNESDNPDDFLSFLYQNYSISSHNEKNAPGWNICTITDASFSLVKNPDNIEPLHNLPLGNTIYILYSCSTKQLYKDKGEEIVSGIKNTFEKMYLNPDGSYKDSIPVHPKVRVLVLPLPEDPKVTLQALHQFTATSEQNELTVNNVASILRAKNEIDSLIDALIQIRQLLNESENSRTSIDAFTLKLSLTLYTRGDESV